MAIIRRNTTEAVNHLAYRLRLRPDDIVVTTIVEQPRPTDGRGLED